MSKAGVAQLVEHDVANVVVESSNLFARSFLFLDENHSQIFSCYLLTRRLRFVTLGYKSNHEVHLTPNNP